MVTATARTPQQDSTSRAAALAAIATTTPEGAATDDLKAELLTSEPVSTETASSGAVVPRQRTGGAVAVRGAYYDISDGALEGEFDQSDIRHPTLKIVNGNGELSSKFNQGTIILGDEELLPAPPADAAKALSAPKLTFFPVQMKKQYQEVLGNDAFENGIMPKIVDTIEEVEAFGGTTQYIEGATNRWRKCGRVLMLVEKPEASDHPLFSIELDGRVFAPAVFFASGGSYDLIKSINSNQVSMFVGEGRDRKIRLWKCGWTFRAVKKKAGDFFVFRPEVRMVLKDLSGSELNEFARNLVSGAPVQADAGE
jgi:hypothetical protein